jgi:hypothetical protein
MDDMPDHMIADVVLDFTDEVVVSSSAWWWIM